MKFLFHFVIFALGAGVGIWWSASNPDAASTIADQEKQQAVRIQAAVAQAKIDLLQKFLSSNSEANASSSSGTPDTGYQRMLDDEKQKLSDAKNQLGGN